MDEDIEAALMRAGQQIDQLQRENTVLRGERDQARASLERAVRLLEGIHGVLYPPLVKLDDGRTMAFRPENAHEFMQTLSDRIRALPDEMEARGLLMPNAEMDRIVEIGRLTRQRDALLEALKSTGLFLHHCWCDVQMNDYSFEKLNQQMQIVDAAIAKAEGEDS